MVKKELFFHNPIAPGNARSLGFSVRFTPAQKPTDENGHALVTMAITQCNRHDKVFSKKIARKVLRERQGKEVRVRDVPNLMSAARWNAVNGAWNEPSDWQVSDYSPMFDFILRKLV